MVQRMWYLLPGGLGIQRERSQAPSWCFIVLFLSFCFWVLPPRLHSLKVCPCKRWYPEQGEKSQSRLDIGCTENFCNCRIKDSQSLMGVLVCQVSLLDSVPGICSSFWRGPRPQGKTANTPRLFTAAAGRGCSDRCCWLPGIVTHRAHFPHS
jgi:hypothetical protein